MLIKNAPRTISALFRHLSHPMRVRILLTIGAGEACVCHLEDALNTRQTYISQHLMALRKAKILKTNRDGRFVYYRLANSEILDLIRSAGLAEGVISEDLKSIPSDKKTCGCPKCSS